ncbi:glycosyltransferase [Phycisphaera mikurensis]|uniref:Putative glycosyltransferase n=1 Tax=Phycisphaera mikurensis (strain NBRC 102666 / KCTC 22515 / FYK2301M01) TaxID=1142394 RepID=I0IBC8_PHYMF|nr:glycosyltransferase [Phycisphaera mikurensis]MBB6443060.1 glycosyltransferase involved in cell wall biosynthesis [Phycisphaera mikurensis]BAM02566.1 putative glycosyltransferase [Phycisphaera mikurensis NBRC 102666]
MPAPAAEPAADAAPVAYLVNAYPKVSHAFIRREIAALEALGQPVQRVSIRAAEGLVDPEDLEEAGRTRVLFEPARLVGPALRAALRPGRLARALGQAMGMAAARGGGLAGRLRHLVYLVEACRLRELVDAAGARHVHAHFGTNPAAVARLCRTLGGPPFSFTVHGPEEFDRPVGLSLASKAADAAFVAAVSSFGRSQLMRWIDPRAWDRIAVVRCGLDAAYLQAGDAGASRPAKADLFVCVGRLCEQKGQHLLVEAVARLAEGGSPVRLRLVGDGPMRADLEAFARERGVADRVEFTGNASAEAVRGHLLDARAMALPSFAEGLPVVLMEALALGRPVISTYIAGIPELVDAGCGWLVPAGDADALAEAMRAALAAPAADLDAMGREGRRRVLERHAAPRIAAQLLGLFDDATPAGERSAAVASAEAEAHATPEDRPAAAAASRVAPAPAA